MLIRLDFENDLPIYRQIRDQIVRGIAEGRLSPGERLPSVRALADETGINMMTVSKAYQLLKAEGYITIGRRNGACVASRAPGKLLAHTREELERVICEARASGCSYEEFMSVCRSLFEQTMEENS